MTATKKVAIAFVLTIITVGVVAAITEKPNPEVAQSDSDVKGNYTEVDLNADAPKVETKDVKEEEMVPFQTVEEPDPSLPAGQTLIARAGVSGAKTITYKITYHDGDAVKKERVSERISLEPVHEVKKVGTGAAAPAESTPTP